MIRVLCLSVHIRTLLLYLLLVLRCCFCHAAKIVLPEGIEPTTYSLEGCCSIQLSYESKYRAPIRVLYWMGALDRQCSKYFYPFWYH